MRKSSALPAILFAGFFSAATLTAQSVSSVPSNPTAEDAADPTAGVRIVRLSQSHGKVLMDRGVHHGFEPAFANLPIVQGASLKTDNSSLAEVEFEDNSSLRLTPDTVVEFTQLARSPYGGTSTMVKVLRGTVYVSLAKSRDNAFTLTSAQGQFSLAPASHIEFQAGDPRTALAVFSGSVQVQVGASITTVGSKKTLLFDPATSATPVLLSRIDKGPYDAWDSFAVSYHKQFMNASTFGGSGISGSTPRYGLSDLNYYGSFSDAGGCGSLWRPYFASAGWDPYGNGVWALYLNAGYSWVSPYPWGWTPYHTGSWSFCFGTGWGWRPGGSYRGLKNALLPTRPKPGPVRIGPPHPPITKEGAAAPASLVAVNTQPLSLSRQSDAGTFVFMNNSAGLGVPRGTFGRLGGASAAATQHGFASVALDGSAAHGSSGFIGSAGGMQGSSRSTPVSSIASSSSSSASHSSFGGSSGGGSSSSGGGHR